MSGNSYIKPNLLIYRAAQFVSGCVPALVFHRKILRNEIKHIKGPFAVIANHQCAYDFVNLIGTTNRPMSFVLSNSFYHSLPRCHYCFAYKHKGPRNRYGFRDLLIDILSSAQCNRDIKVRVPSGAGL